MGRGQITGIGHDWRHQRHQTLRIKVTRIGDGTSATGESIGVCSWIEGNERGRVNVSACRKQATHIHIGITAEGNAGRIEQPHMTVGLQHPVDDALRNGAATADYPVKGNGLIARLQKRNALPVVDRKRFPINSDPVAALSDDDSAGRSPNGIGGRVRRLHDRATAWVSQRGRRRGGKPRSSQQRHGRYSWRRARRISFPPPRETDPQPSDTRPWQAAPHWW